MNHIAFFVSSKPKKRYIYIGSGIPGSGKTTFLKKLAAEHREGSAIVVSRDIFRDQLRTEMGVSSYFPVAGFKEDYLWQRALEDIFAENYTHIYIDQTSINTKAISRLLMLISHLLNPQDEIFIYRFWTPFEVCIKRNENRPLLKKVPDSAMLHFLRLFHEPLNIEALNKIHPISALIPVLGGYYE
ncbi:AAA family ATPase [Massilibacteroides sp.]|uniref:AAA family ATPase n=1 Tax=Massilibacteroides sp. TaxID=2034766 RepID=UPI00260C7D76|nr:AAA family ATPase [Massilibacteroides sp.]MDD4516579.1 AAA family ATPase [Massilibacteroides sp.]